MGTAYAEGSDVFLDVGGDSHLLTADEAATLGQALIDAGQAATNHRAGELHQAAIDSHTAELSAEQTPAPEPVEGSAEEEAEDAAQEQARRDRYNAKRRERRAAAAKAKAAASKPKAKAKSKAKK